METRTVSLQTFQQLIEYRIINDRPKFIALMKTILPEVRVYLSRRLETALKNKQLPENKYELADFADELYIKAFDHIQEVEHESKLFLWLMQKADELIEDSIIEEDFDDFFFHKIGDYSKKEWQDIVANYSTESYANGVPNDSKKNTPNYLYTIDDVIADTDTAFKQKMEEQFSEVQIHQMINTALHKMPNDLITVFDLRANHTLDFDEIKQIKQFTAEAVQQNVKEAKGFIKKVFEQRMAGTE